MTDEQRFKQVLEGTRAQLLGDAPGTCLDALSTFAVRAPFRKRALALLKEVPHFLAQRPINPAVLEAFAATAVALNYPILGKAVRKAYLLAEREARPSTGPLALALAALGVHAAIPDIRRVLATGGAGAEENRRALEQLEATLLGD